jgi:hypothetical protein
LASLASLASPLIAASICTQQRSLPRLDLASPQCLSIAHLPFIADQLKERIASSSF